MINLLPSPTNENIKKVIAVLKITSEPFYVHIISEQEAQNGFCYENVLGKIKKSAGSIVYGWYFREYDYMIEAEFHAIWKSPEGLLIDITPPQDPILKQILFVIDESRNFNIKYREPFRFNTTLNELVDDIIELESVKFKFEGSCYDENGVRKTDLNQNALQMTWNIIMYTSEGVEKLFKAGGNLDTNCFCNSGIRYKSCHHKILIELLRF